MFAQTPMLAGYDEHIDIDTLIHPGAYTTARTSLANLIARGLRFFRLGHARP